MIFLEINIVICIKECTFFSCFLTPDVYPRKVMKRRKNVGKVHLSIVYNPKKLKTMSSCPKYPTNIVFEHPNERNIL